MPEYLAPGVYVEEVDTGSKPIEGVSTSTAGVVGVTERGPLNVPLLITSIGDFYRKFGGRLDFEEFTNDQDQRCHGYLPYALEGFFRNLGKRAYVTRVAPEDSANAGRELFDRGEGGAAALLVRGASENTASLRVADASGIGQGDVIRIGDGSRAEYREVVLATEVASADNIEAKLPLDVAAYEEYAQGSIIQTVDMDDDDRETAGGSHTKTIIGLNSVDGMEVGLEVKIGNEPERIIESVDTSAKKITVTLELNDVPNDGVDVIAATVSTKSLTVEVVTGSVVLTLDNRLGLSADDVIRIGEHPDEEYVTIAEIPGDRTAPDSGDILLTSPLRHGYDVNAPVRRQHTPESNAARPDATLILSTEENAKELYVENGAPYRHDDIFRITLPSSAVHYHRLDSDEDKFIPVVDLELDGNLNNSHEIGQPVVVRNAIMGVAALDPGSWGNRLRISVEDEGRGLASSADVVTPLDPLIRNQLRLNTLTGVESGTVLELFDPGTGDAVGGLLKVSAVNRAANNLVILDGNMLDDEQIGVSPLGARSREFRLTTHVMRRPDAAVPSRDDTVVDSEIFAQLSMDPRHSRYVETVIGTLWDPGSDIDANGTPLRKWDRRSEGESLYIRIEDTAEDEATEHSVRVGPEALVDTLADGRTRTARLALAGGGDAVGNMTDAMYVGVDDAEPENRSGIHSLSNIEQISLVACPGQSSASVQQALINHCEALRYRFAVLDGREPRNDTLTDVMAQRQQFDTKYAALYHPWLMIPDPMPDNLSSIRQVPIPPSGHMLGVYARTDIERGVHKAPANETVRGITGLARTLNKAEHDILNPYPVNINVIRDFRPDNRGIRVWGVRCISSDPDYKYVNVRRLMIFLEHSIDRGLQWVVFEPNAEPLWARVRRSIANFLTVAWRNGALEGTSPEEAFFVKCDRETMTQTDIDNGRLICQVGVAVVKPAEYAIIRMGLWTAHADEN